MFEGARVTVDDLQFLFIWERTWSCFCTNFPSFPGSLQSGIRVVFIPMVILFVCLERDINMPTWKKLLLERVVFKACCGVGSSKLGDPDQDRQ